MNRMTKFLIYFCGISLCFTLGFLGAVGISKLDLKKLVFPKVFIIESGSMEPSIKTGGIVVTLPQQIYKVNDVVTFSYENDAKNLVTHRIEYKSYANGKPEYKTSGDANNSFDAQTITDSNIVGKVIFTVPYLGYFADFAKKPQGFILLIVVPATIIIYEELKSLKKEIWKRLKKIKFKNPFFKRTDLKEKKKNNASEDNQPDAKVRKVAIVIPFMGAFLLFLNFSSSFFSDTETSLSNTFTAAVPTPSPAPITPPIKINEVYPVGENKGEWVELYNAGFENVDISGWKIADATAFGSGQDDTLPTTPLLTPGKYALVITNQSTVNISSVPSDTLIITLTSANIGSGLNETGDLVVIKNSSNVIQDEMSYGSNSTAFSNPPKVPSINQSLSRIFDGYDTDVASDWQIKAPTMGTTN